MVIKIRATRGITVIVPLKTHAPFSLQDVVVATNTFYPYKFKNGNMELHSFGQ